MLCLAVDDDHASLELLEEMASVAHMEVASAKSGKEAFEFCAKAKIPDIILLDWEMPDINGIEFLQYLRKIPDGNKVYVVMCSGRCNKADIDIAMQKGADMYLAKPYNVTKMKEQLKNTSELPNWKKRRSGNM